MGSVKATRVDFRLVHGQVQVTWIRKLNATKVIVVSEAAAADSFLKKMIMLASPPGCKLAVYTVDEAMEAWKKDKFGPGNILVLFQYVEEAYKAYQSGFKFPSLNVANTTNNDDMYHLSRTVNITKEQHAMLLDLLDKGVNIFNQGTADESPVKLEKPLRDLA